MDGLKIPISNHIEFYNWQLQELYDSYQIYLKTAVQSHLASRTAYLGEVHGLDYKRNNLIIKFGKGLAPRLNEPLIGFLFLRIPVRNSILDWTLTYEAFRENHVAIETDVLPVYFLPNAQNINLVGFRDVDFDFFQVVKSQLEKDKKISILFAKRDPPYKYLENLKNFIEFFQHDEILNLDLRKELSSWQPSIFNKNQSKKSQILSSLKVSDEIIIQGPPGTGKSTLISELVKYFTDEQKSVCVTALTNKALLELVEKEGISQKAKEGKVYKTNLSSNEIKRVPSLKKANELSISKGELVLASYFKLSDWFSKENILSTKNNIPVYDVLIIEEASQAFLATIAAFRLLGTKVIVIGDPLQLTPIVLNENKASQIHPFIHKIILGLSSFVANTEIVSFILDETYRLSKVATKLTSLFYDTPLTSKVSEDVKKLIINDSLAKYIPSKGGVAIQYLPMITDGDLPEAAVNLAILIIEDLLKHNQESTFAILAPFKRTVLLLQEEAGRIINDQSNLVIETIDRVQGLTVDYNIFIIALSNPEFALNLNRFNVATSRAKYGTLIITDNNYIRFKGIDPRVTKYLQNVEKI